jgi:hypothetical protein
MTSAEVNTLDPRIVRIQELLQNQGGRFDNYQALPASIVRKIPALGDLAYTQNQIGLDETRYEWLRRHFVHEGFTVADIGGNMGYFSLSLAADAGAEATLFEPVSALCEACLLLAEIGDLKGIKATDHPVGLDDLAALPTFDLVIHLNVLHHAGVVFDRDAVTRLGGWRPYAKQYLEALSRRARQLFFQTGNVSSGGAHFSGAEMVPFLFALLDSAGWEVEKVGIIEDYVSFEYSSYEPAELAAAPIVTCRRNPETNLVEYRVNGDLAAALPKGIAQRPLWLAKSKNLR